MNTHRNHKLLGQLEALWAKFLHAFNRNEVEKWNMPERIPEDYCHHA